MSKKKGLFLLFIMIMVMLAPTTVFAKNPYKDVTKKKVDKESYKAIVYLKEHGGWNGIAKKGKLSPNKYVTRRDYLIILHNLYGDKVTATMADLRAANQKVTSKFACDRMVLLAKKLNYPIKWNGNKSKLRRKDVARYIYIFATFNKALTPKK